MLIFFANQRQQMQSETRHVVQPKRISLNLLIDERWHPSERDQQIGFSINNVSKRRHQTAQRRKTSDQQIGFSINNESKKRHQTAQRRTTLPPLTNQTRVQHFFCRNGLQQFGGLAALIANRVRGKDVRRDGGELCSQRPSQRASHARQILQRERAACNHIARAKRVVEHVLSTRIRLLQSKTQFVTRDLKENMNKKTRERQFKPFRTSDEIDVREQPRTVVLTASTATASGLEIRANRAPCSTAWVELAMPKSRNAI
jgi:hypothetical protein